MVSGLMLIPASNADSERVFFHVQKSYRSRINSKKINNSSFIGHNFNRDISYTTFYEELLNNVQKTTTVLYYKKKIPIKMGVVWVRLY